MKERKPTTKQREKFNTRFIKEKIKKCETCKYFFNSTCTDTGYRRYKNEIACFRYEKTN